MAGRIRDADVVLVRERARIDEVVGERLQLRPAGGGRLKGLCPFHDEKSPSFNVNPSLGFYHCLAGETRVLTWEGVRPIRELAGGTHRVLGRRGDWVDAPFASYGRQKLFALTLSRDGQRKVVRATSGHRWFVPSGRGRTPLREVVTTDLRPGHRLATVAPRHRARRTALSPVGVQHGITSAAGTRTPDGCRAQLRGDQDALLKWFPLDRTVQAEPGRLLVLDLPNAFADLPDLDESTSYLLGWLAGCLAAAGHVSEDGTVVLDTARREHLEHVRLLCARLGIGTYAVTGQVREGFAGREPSEVLAVHLVPGDLSEELFLLDEHRRRVAARGGSSARRGWTVVGVEETDDVEEVFCAEVADGHAFVLEDDLLTGNCFGCGVSGDVITFLRESEHLSFVEAVEVLAGRYGVQLTYEQGGAAPGRQVSQRARLVEVNRAAAAFFAEQLGAPGAAPARAFLAERGFDRATAATYGLGHAPEGWDLLVRHLRGKGFSTEELLAAGVASQGRQGPIDRFRQRLVWPIRDLTGEVVGFGARKLSTDPRDDSPKYLNTPETPLYKKSSVLYGLDAAKKEIARRRQVVVVEGYTDVMACHLAGVPTAVATCGTAFGSEHIGVLRRLLMDSGELRGEVVFLFDGDAAGQKAALKAFDSEQEFVTQTFVAISPGGTDPCELRLAAGDTAVRDLVAARVPLVEFAVRSTLARHDLETAEGRVNALAAAAPLVARVKDRALRPEYARRLAGWLGMDVETVLGRVAELSGDARAPRQRRTGPPALDAATVAVEREAVKLAVQLPVLVAPLFDAVDEQAWTDEALRAVRAVVAKAGGVSTTAGGEAWVALLRETADDEAVRGTVAELAVEPLRSGDEPDQRYAAAVLGRLQEFALSRRTAELKPQLQRVNPVEEPERYGRLFAELVALEQSVRALRERGAGQP